MPQHDYNIANDTAANVRSDLNNALSAIATNNSGASEPSVTYANQWWYDTTNDLLKIRNEADSAWINFATVNQTDGRIEFSTVYAGNFSDGTLSVPADSVTQGTAKVWVNFNGAGTVATRDSYNVSSITDNGTGDYTVNFTNNFSTTDYNHGGMAGLNNGNLINVSQNVSDLAPTASSARYQITFTNTSTIDATFVGISNEGDLA